MPASVTRWETLLTWILAGHLCACVTIDDCNRTVDTRHLAADVNTTQTHPSEKLTFRFDAQGQPEQSVIYCQIRLLTDDGRYIVVDVSKLNVGVYDETEKRCSDGYFRISDTTQSTPSHLPPTTLCGRYDNIRVKRYTSGPSAVVEFNKHQSQPDLRNEFDARFVDKDEDSNDPDADLPFGDIHRRSGRKDGPECEWEIPVDECVSNCQLISPGYPGIYPSNYRCRYMIVNNEDARVEIKFGGRYGKFDLKKSLSCAEDYLLVYDGPTSGHPLIGRFCGHNSAYLISSGRAMLLEFVSTHGEPPWDYSGFQIDLTHRWKNEHEFGTRSPGTLCDWSFHSSPDSLSGDLHTPDHMIPAQTTCVYTFDGLPWQHVQLRITLSYLLEDCREKLDVYDGDVKLDTICDDRIQKKRRRQDLDYITTSNRAAIRYHIQEDRMSNHRPVWIAYTFSGEPPGSGHSGGSNISDTITTELPLTGGFSLSNLTSTGHVMTFDILSGLFSMTIVTFIRTL